MAFCPKCHGVMSTNELACLHCGFDFPEIKSPRTGIAYSAFADFALIVSSAVAAFGALVGVYWSVVTLIQGQWWNGLIIGPMASLLQVGMLVAFLRIQDT